MVDGFANIIFIGDIAVDEGGSGAEVAADWDSELILDVGDDYFCSVLMEEPRRALTYAAGTASDESNFAL